MDRYLSPAVMQSVMDQLLQAKQTADESLNQYYNRFKYLDKVVASRTADWYIGRFEVNCFVKGFLNKTLSDNVCRRYPKTLDEAYQFALEENRLFYMQSGQQQTTSHPPPPPPKPDNPPPQQSQNQGSQNQGQQNPSQQNNNNNRNWSKNNNKGWQNNNQRQNNNNNNNNNQRQNQSQNQNRQNRPKCATCGFANHQSAACWYNPSGQNFKGITYNPEKHSYEAFLKRRADQNSGQNTGQGNANNNKSQSQNQGGRGQGGRTFKNNNANAITNTAGRQNTINSIPNAQQQPSSTAPPPISVSPPLATVDKQFMADFASHFWEELYKSNPANIVPFNIQGNDGATASYPVGWQYGPNSHVTTLKDSPTPQEALIMYKKTFRNKCIQKWTEPVDDDFCVSCTESASDFCVQCSACSCVCQCSQSQCTSQSGVEGGPPTLRQFFSRPSSGVSGGSDLAVQGVTEEIFAVPPQMNMGQVKSLTRISVGVEGILSVALVDTGSCANIISSQRFQSMQQLQCCDRDRFSVQPFERVLFSANNKPIPMSGIVSLNLEVGHLKLRDIPFLLSDSSSAFSEELCLGRPFIQLFDSLTLHRDHIIFSQPQSTPHVLVEGSTQVQLELLTDAYQTQASRFKFFNPSDVVIPAMTGTQLPVVTSCFDDIPPDGTIVDFYLEPHPGLSSNVGLAALTAVVGRGSVVTVPLLNPSPYDVWLRKGEELGIVRQLTDTTLTPQEFVNQFKSEVDLSKPLPVVKTNNAPLYSNSHAYNAI